MKEIDIEYIQRRCAINEMVLQDLGYLIATHLPAILPQLQEMGKAWDNAIDKLEEDYK